MLETSKPKHSNEDTERRAFGEKLEEFRDALNLLYIKKNQSGRLKFAEKWRAPAEYIFGADLLEIDTRGPSLDEYAVRLQLEEAAEDRRLQLKQTLGELKEKSVDSGVLQFEYVGKIIQQYGPELSRIFFADNIIERVSPGLLARFDEERRQREAQAEAERLRAEEAIRAKAQGLPPETKVRPPKAQPVPHANIDIPDEVRPIDAAASGSVATNISAPPSEPVPLPPEPAPDEVRPIDFSEPVPPVAAVAEPVVPSASVPQAAPVDVAPVGLVQKTLSVADVPPPGFSKPEKGSCRLAFSRALAAAADAPLHVI